jgi:hypothetical protein
LDYRVAQTDHGTSKWGFLMYSEGIFFLFLELLIKFLFYF